MKSAIIFTPAIFSIAVLFSGCSSNEIGNSKDADPETVYQQYTLSYTAGEPIFEGSAQFRFAGEDGTTLVLSEPSNISFDNSVIKVDNNDIAGAYYPIKQPAANFYGRHQFTFTGINHKIYTNEFTVDSITVNSLPLVAYKSAPLQLTFNGLAAEADYFIEANSSNTDSTFTVTFSSPGKKTLLEIPASQLMRQKGKELTLNIAVTRKVPLQNSTREGGMILLSYNMVPVTIKLEETPPVSMIVNAGMEKPGIFRF